MQILEQCSDHGPAAHRLAQIALERNQHERAVELLGHVSNLLPDDPNVLTDLARAYVGLGRAQDALTCLERASVIFPNQARTEQIFAKAYSSTGRFDRAMTHADKAVRLDPGDAKSHESQGDVMLELREMPRAIECYDRALAIAPDNWQAYANQGIALMFLGRLEDARNALTFSNALHPLQPNVMLQLSMVLIDLGEYDNAGLLLDRLSAMTPQNPNVLRLCGINALRKGEPRSAVSSLIKSLSQDENNVEIQCLLSEALHKEGKVENAITVLNQVLDKDKTHGRAYVQKAKAQFLLGRLDEGFASVEALHSHKEARLSAPVWDGDELEGKTILLYSEFGLDELNLFVRFAKYAKQKGGNVLVECTQPVFSLVEAMDGVDSCCEAGEETAPIDCHISLERLPGLLKIGKGDIDTNSYLAAPSHLVDKWRERLSAIEKPKIGLMWRKETDVLPDVYHSLPLSALAPLFEIDDIHFVSLQTSVGLGELEEFPFKDKMQSVGLENTPMDERLACLSNLDLLITADTLTAQIASAAGLPVWFILGRVPKWHFGLEGETSMWHPTARLFRQTETGKWDTAVDCVKGALVQWIAADRT